MRNVFSYLTEVFDEQQREFEFEERNQNSILFTCGSLKSIFVLVYFGQIKVFRVWGKARLKYFAFCDKKSFFLNQPDKNFRWKSSSHIYHCWILVSRFLFPFRRKHEDVTICWWVSTKYPAKISQIFRPCYSTQSENVFFPPVSRLHLNFPKRSEITFQYPCMLLLSPS